jgi:hypothetical protein
MRCVSKVGILKSIWMGRVEEREGDHDNNEYGEGYLSYGCAF